MIAVSEVVLFGLILTIIGLGFGILLLFLSMKKNAPEAFLFMKARRKKMPMVFVHYPEGTVVPSIPQIQRGSPASSPEYIIENTGIKFRNPDSRKAERWFGDITIHNYFRNMPEEVSVKDVVAMDQLKELFGRNNVSIENIEDIAFYVLSEVEKTGDVKRALQNAGIRDEETAMKLLRFLKFVDEHKEEIKKEKLESGIFAYQTAVTALDRVMAYTSANLSHAKSVWEAMIRNQLSNRVKDLMTYGIFLFVLCLGVGALAILVK